MMRVAAWTTTTTTTTIGHVISRIQAFQKRPANGIWVVRASATATKNSSRNVRNDEDSYGNIDDRLGLRLIGRKRVPERSNNEGYYGNLNDP